MGSNNDQKIKFEREKEEHRAKEHDETMKNLREKDEIRKDPKDRISFKHDIF